MRNRYPTGAKALALGATALACGLAVALWPELPQWRPGGTRSIPASSVGSLVHPSGCPGDGTTIAIIGDSHVAGSRMGAGGEPFGAVLAQALPGKVTVERFGIGGETAAGGERRWRGRDLPEAGLVILAYGTNDAAPRGWLRDKDAVPLADFRAALMRQIKAWRAADHQVALLAPPPGGSSAIASRLAPYRAATRDVGREAGVNVYDPADAFAACPAAQPVLVADALHMNAAGHRCLGEWLAHQMCSPARSDLPRE